MSPRRLTRPRAALPFTFTESQRKELVQSLLDDVKAPEKRIGKQSAWSARFASPPADDPPLDVPTALNAIKMLGRQTATAQVIANQDVRTLTLLSDHTALIEHFRTSTCWLRP